MSELRWHPLLEEWVVTATHRQERTFLPPKDYCPLCPTQVGGFPTEVPRDHYNIVVFENKFPSLQQNPPVPAVGSMSLSPVEAARGICEVVLYSSEHQSTLAEMPWIRLEHLIHVWQERTVELGAKDFVSCVYIFENKGEAVGVTLHHPHGQIYAFPYIPPKIQKEIDASLRHYQQTQRCLFCDVITDELRDGRRIVLEGDLFVAFIPFFARYPYEVYIAPKHHQATMGELTREERKELALLLKGLLMKYDSLFGFSFPYIMAVHQAPTDGSVDSCYHWHFEFYPPHRTANKLKYLAGCEAGAGSYINDTLAEEKAEELRHAGPTDLEAVQKIV